jgi:hypothetical protein
VLTLPRLFAALGSAAAAVVLAACSASTAAPGASSSAPTGGSAGASATASPSPSNPYGVLAVDPPGPADPVLVVHGGSAGTVSLTLAQLEALGTTTITVDEPFVKQRLSFTGVPMSAVLTRAGIPAGAYLTTKALNDYDYANQASAFTASDALIATRRGDSPVPFDAGGPIRLVYPDGSPLSSVLDAWNWSIGAIDVTPQGSAG